MKIVSSLVAFATLALTGSLAAQVPGRPVTPYGNSCGPIATGEVLPNGGNIRFNFTMTGTPRTQLLLVVGVNEIAVPLPTTNCPLLTENAFVQQHRTDAAGVYSFSHAIGGGGSFNSYARVQFLELRIDANNNIMIFPSNGLFMDCTGRP